MLASEVLILSMSGLAFRVQVSVLQIKIVVARREAPISYRPPCPDWIYCHRARMLSRGNVLP